MTTLSGMIFWYSERDECRTLDRTQRMNCRRYPAVSAYRTGSKQTVARRSWSIQRLSWMLFGWSIAIVYPCLFSESCSKVDAPWSVHVLLVALLCSSCISNEATTFIGQNCSAQDRTPKANALQALQAVYVLYLCLQLSSRCVVLANNNIWLQVISCIVLGLVSPLGSHIPSTASSACTFKSLDLTSN